MYRPHPWHRVFAMLLLDSLLLIPAQAAFAAGSD